MKLMDCLHSWNREVDYTVRKADWDHYKIHESKAREVHLLGGKGQ